MEEDRIDEVSMIKDMSIYRKIQKVKLELSSRELKKSGENSYSGFKYYELGDFLPSIIELCDKYGLCTKVSFVESYNWEKTEKDGITKTVPAGERAVLTIINSDKPEEIEEYECDVKTLTLKATNDIQNYGGAQTYLRRYLYMNAFDIVEADMFDSQEFEKKKKKKAEKNDVVELATACKKAFAKADTEVKTKAGNLMKTFGYSTFADLEEKQEKSDIIELANTLGVEVPEKLKNN